MSKQKMETVTPEWSHMIDVEEIGSAPVKFDIAPDESQINSLLGRLGVKKIEDLQAHITVGMKNMVYHAKGSVQAKITQDCVVTLDPIVTEINEEVEGWFADAEAAVSIAKARHERDLKKGQVEVPMLEESEDPEPVIDGKIDLGELATQFLSLAINPYPHAEGVEYEFGDDKSQEEASDLRKNPFAALKDWKDKL